MFKNGHAKLGDLNVSKVAKRGLGYTQTGTPYYASPEIWKDLPYDNKSDIWSLGCVLYEMITLHPPFKAKNMDELYKKVLSGDIEKLPSKFSNDLYEVVLLLMKVNSNKRPNCGDILNNIHVKKRIEFFNNMNNNDNDGNLVNVDEKEEQSLLKTIRIPKNLLFLGNQLPKPNYNKSKNKISVKITTTIPKNIMDLKPQLPKLNLNSKPSEETKNSLSIACTITKQNSLNSLNTHEKEEPLNDIYLQNKNNINNSNIDIKNEVQYYKKLYAINKKIMKPVKKNRSLDKNIPLDYNNSRIYYNIKNNYPQNISSKYSKLYKLYEPNKKQIEIKKMAKYKILNSLRNVNNKYNIYWKNREELYKDLNKNIGIKSELIQMLNKEKNYCDYSEGSSGIFSQMNIGNEIKVYKSKGKLSPISIYKRDVMQ